MQGHQGQTMDEHESLAGEIEEQITGALDTAFESETEGRREHADFGLTTLLSDFTNDPNHYNQVALEKGIKEYEEPYA